MRGVWLKVGSIEGNTSGTPFNSYPRFDVAGLSDTQPIRAKQKNAPCGAFFVAGMDFSG